MGLELFREYGLPERIITESPSHTVGLEQINFQLSEQELIYLSPSHAVGSEHIEIATYEKFRDKIKSPSHTVGSELNKEVRGHDNIRTSHHPTWWA